MAIAEHCLSKYVKPGLGPGFTRLVSGSTFVFFAAALFAWSNGVEGGDWVGGLVGGGEIKVDGDSRRAFRVDGGREVPLWDGTHRLQDGTTVIVKDGIAVPTREMYSEWETQVSTNADRPWCDRLVEKSCGGDGSCARNDACERARDLFAREQSLRRAGGGEWVEAVDACRFGLTEARFTVCGDGRGLNVSRSCRDLVNKACGPANACGDSPGCDVARQLLSLELEERMVNERSRPTEASRQCSEALEMSYFERCRSD